jgi:hypothetical protein
VQNVRESHATKHTCYRQTIPHIGWMLFENDAKTVDIKMLIQTILAPGVLLGANGQPGSYAVGNILMLLMKPAFAQGGKPPKFSTSITKVCRIPYAHESVSGLSDREKRKPFVTSSCFLTSPDSPEASPSPRR